MTEPTCMDCEFYIFIVFKGKPGSICDFHNRLMISPKEKPCEDFVRKGEGE